MSGRCIVLATAGTTRATRVTSGDGVAKDLTLKGEQEKEGLTAGGELAMVHAYCMPGSAQEGGKKSSANGTSVLVTNTPPADVAPEDMNSGSLPHHATTTLEKESKKRKKETATWMPLWASCCIHTLSPLASEALAGVSALSTAGTVESVVACQLLLWRK